MPTADAIAVAVSALGWCLVDFVWQALVVGIAYALVRVSVPRGNPRYLAAMAAMLALAAWPAATAWRAWSAHAALAGGIGGVAAVGTVAASNGVSAALSAGLPRVAAALPWLVLAWAVGVGVLGIRVARQWWGLQRMLRAAETEPRWQARGRALARRLGMRRLVPVLASVRVATPVLVGWVRPAVVLPLAVLARMPAAQIDLILAHELAHLRRFDHFANLFQVIVETLFFYHPVVHWISREARNERELCCDALALRATGGERRDFVAALAGLEELRVADPGLVLAASGGVLVERASFIAGVAPRHARRHIRNLVPVGMAVIALAAGWLWWRNVAWQQRTAALLASNNATVLRLVQQDATRAPALIGVPAVPTRLHLSAAVFSQAPALEVGNAAASAPRVPVAAVAAPRLDVAPLKPALAAIALPTSTVAAPPLPPRALRIVPPVYPPDALASGARGTVVVEFALDAAGVPRDITVVESGGAAFDAAARRALAGWRFAPRAAAGRRYLQSFTFAPGAADGQGGADADTCRIATGTHICRRAFDAAPEVRVLRPSP